MKQIAVSRALLKLRHVSVPKCCWTLVISSGVLRGGLVEIGPGLLLGTHRILVNRLQRRAILSHQVVDQRHVFERCVFVRYDAVDV